MSDDMLVPVRAVVEFQVCTHGGERSAMEDALKYIDKHYSGPDCVAMSGVYVKGSAKVRVAGIRPVSQGDAHGRENKKGN